MMSRNAKILVTGSSGMVGSALVRQLRQQGFENLLAPAHAELDLLQQATVNEYFNLQRPDYVFHLAAIVGGIHANNAYPGKFIYDNTQMHCNVIHAAYTHGIKKILFPGSACTYPKLAEQPIAENSFLNGLIEPTNLAYAVAKINGVVMCQSYAKQYGLNAIVPMPTNAYGVGDNFNETFSHVIPALMKRFHDAKISGLEKVELWGTGKPLREFIYADDLADAFIFLMETYNSPEIINVGTMQEISMVELAYAMAKVTGYPGEILLDINKPDGAPRKCLDSRRLFALGWKPKISLEAGLLTMYQHYLATADNCGNSLTARA